VNEREQVVIEAARDGPRRASPPLARLVAANFNQRVKLDESAFAETFSEVSTKRFGRTETEYKEWSVEQLQRKHTTTVEYTGDNNVTYTKTCEPKQSDIAVESITPVYVPRIRASVDFGSYTYHYEYFAAGPSRYTIDDGIHRCQQCGDSEAEQFTYCANCDSINCPGHTETERLIGEPVCTGCAVTERFFYSKKYFYDESNREQFRAEYESMPLYERAQENTPLLAGIALTALVVVLFVLVGAGIV